MPEKLAVFADGAENAFTDQTSSTDLVVNSATEQGYITSMQYTVYDEQYDVEVTLEQGGSVVAKNTTGAGSTATTYLQGPHIIDVDQTLKLSTDSGPQKYWTGLKRAMLFDITNGQWILGTTDTSSLPLADSHKKFADEYANFTQVQLNSGAGYRADSACACYRNDIETYTRMHQGSPSSSYTYDEDGNLLLTISDWANQTYGMTTDGTYFYGLDNGGGNILERRLVSDGSNPGDITMSENVNGPNANQGAFTHYYDGHVYTHQTGSTTTANKINTTTGLVTPLTGVSGSGYSSGSAVTVAVDGTPYILEKTGAGTTVNIYNLNTWTFTTATMPSLSTSTEYGNLAVECSPGVVAFFYNSNFVVYDVNDNSNHGKWANSTYNFPPMNSNGSSSSVANFPIHELRNGGEMPRSTTLSIIADGVKITGVV